MNEMGLVPQMIGEEAIMSLESTQTIMGGTCMCAIMKSTVVTL